MMKKTLGILTIVTLLGACKSTEQMTNDAMLSQALDKNVEAIQDAIAPFFNGARIPLAFDVFTRSSELVIDKRTVLDKAGNVINGKDIRLPGDGSASGQRFLLKSSNTHCFLVHEASGARLDLELVNCVPVTDSAS
jgi:hypothetical protein